MPTAGLLSIVFPRIRCLTVLGSASTGTGSVGRKPWNGTNLRGIIGGQEWEDPDGVTFDSSTGALYLCSDGQGVALFDRNTAAFQSYVTVTPSPGGYALGYDLASLVSTVPPSGGPGGSGPTRTWGFYKTHWQLLTSINAMGCINLGILTVTSQQLPPNGERRT